MWTKFENWTGDYIFALSKNGTKAVLTTAIAHKKREHSSSR